MTNNPKKIFVVFGTRPEAIKLAPVLRALKKNKFDFRIVVFRQHREMLDQVLKTFLVDPDHEFNVGLSNKLVFSSDIPVFKKIAKIINSVLDLVRFFWLLRKNKPDLLVVQGDTNTAALATLAGFFAGVKVGHVEAGLRTYKWLSPFPEEINRRIISKAASIHFAPTEGAKGNLVREGTDERTVHVTGNTEIDAMKYILDRQLEDKNFRPGFVPNAEKKLILVTAHRRESFGEGIKNICAGLLRIARAHPDAQIVYPVHPNPNVEKPVRALLAGQSNIHLTSPMNYDDFVFLMNKAHIILTDSGGIQEATSFLGTPTLVMRDVTERPEAVTGGTAKLVGTDPEKIFSETTKLWNDKAHYATMQKKHSAFGDGTAAEKIVDALTKYLN